MIPENCIYRNQPWAGIEYYQCKCLTEVTKHGLLLVKCDEETCPIAKGCTVEIPAALQPLLEYYGNTLKKLEKRIEALETEITK